MEEKQLDLKDPTLYINRELSWLEFNRRVLEEAWDPDTPIMEKLKFLSIFSSNLDEFFMVRVGGLARLVDAQLVEDRDATGRTPLDQLRDISEKTRDIVMEQYRCLSEKVLPALESLGIRIQRMSDLSKGEMQRLERYFVEQVSPVLTPLAVDAGHPFPYLGNLRLNIMVAFGELNPDQLLQAFAFVEVPAVLPRLIPVSADSPNRNFVLLEDLIQTHISHLFPGMPVSRMITFRATRNLDYDLHESDVSDLLKSVEAELVNRSNQIAVRLETEQEVPVEMIQCLTNRMTVRQENIYFLPGPLNICDLMTLYDLPVDEANKDQPFNPRIPRRLANCRDIFRCIRDKDILLHHPFDSFAVIVEFLNSAADDPDVLAIKQTLYRTGTNSPIIAALRRAAENGKQVTAVLELKARFDERSNIDWALQLEQAGINVVYGFVNWKVHSKATLVVRREGDTLRRYVHLSTGNYNSTTAKIYTDLGLLTVDTEFGNDVSAMFNVITGFNSWTGEGMFRPETVVSMFSKLALAPVNAQDKMIELIQREAKLSTPENPGRIIGKMNALVDPQTIRELYKASQSGVRIDLIVRGICCLRPGVPGVSDNIRVISILDRFLEHTRIYYFHNGGDPEIYSGSADWMPRNFRRRVEILFPVEDKDVKSRIIKEILMTYLRDNVKARIQQPDGSYIRVARGSGEKRVRSQERLIAIARKGGVKSIPYEDLVRQVGKKKKKS